MSVVFDQGTPAPLRRHLAGHVVYTAFECGWSSLENGELLDAAEGDGYAVLITTDHNLKHQQHLAGRQLAVIVLLSTSWPRIQSWVSEIQAAINAIGSGGYVEIPIP